MWSSIAIAIVCISGRLAVDSWRRMSGGCGVNECVQMPYLLNRQFLRTEIEQAEICQRKGLMRLQSEGKKIFSDGQREGRRLFRHDN